MLIRYGTNEKGKRVERARIYTVEEHGIRRESIDRGALFITRTLHRNGFEAYVVGGAVRDLLLGKVPKDFDIATNALPRRIKKMFRNAHVIGKRFRLVHVPMGDDIIEVSTFRALTNGQPAAGDQGTDENNVYGTLDEDVLRRDFTFNALYYSPVNETIIDFVGGVKDIRAKRIRCLIPRKEIFRDDPVRIIRAIKYSSMAGFTIPFLTRLQIAKDAPLIRDCSHSRLTEELFKILKCGSSSLILRNARRLKVLSHLLPGIDAKISSDSSPKSAETRLFESLDALDGLIASHPEVKKGVMIKHLVAPFIPLPAQCENPAQLHKELFASIKLIMSPITPPNFDVEDAVRMMMREAGFRSMRASVQTNRRRYAGGDQEKPRTGEGGARRRRRPRPAAKPKEEKAQNS